MKETDIRKYAGLMHELGLTGLEITEDNKVVRLERTAPVLERQTPVYSADNVLPLSGQDKVNTDSDYISIKSPIVGVFYASSAENASPYVSVGDRVKKGQTLCLVEAMKLMNEISAEDDGIISEICVANGQVVEFGTELFRIRK